MMCLRHFLIFLIIFPFPAASPLFMLALLLAMWVKLRPCNYCTAILTILYTAFANPSFINLSFPSDLSRTPGTLPPLPLSNTSLSQILHAIPALETNSAQGIVSDQSSTLLDSFQWNQPVHNRSWADLNYGRILWPKLEGYRLIDQYRAEEKEKRINSVVKQDENEGLTTASADTGCQSEDPVHDASHHYIHDTDRDQANIVTADTLDLSSQQEYQHYLLDLISRISSRIPRRLDFRIRNIGLVLDLSFSRSSSAVKQEVTEWIAWEKRKTASLTNNAKHNQDTLLGEQEAVKVLDKAVEQLGAEPSEA